MGSVGTLIAWASVILKLEFALPLGSVFGSILGGRWSGRTLARLKAANDGIGNGCIIDETRKHQACNVVVPAGCYRVCLGLPTTRAYLSDLCDALLVWVLFDMDIY